MGDQKTVGIVYTGYIFGFGNIIVSFKQNLRVINKATNRFLHYNEEGKRSL